MPEHQQKQQSKNPEPSSQRRTTFAIQNHVSNPAAIIQRARIDPKYLTSADVLQLQHTIGNRAVGRLLSEIRRPSSTVQQLPVQRQEIPEEEEPLQGMFESKSEEDTCPSCIQRQEVPEEEPLQGKMIGTIQRQEIPEEEEPLQIKRENNTGMPDNLKAGVESLSGIDMSDVRVHYNSSKPVGVGALAYTQGTDIHVAPGQERHLPHEAWHVVQQKQGRVKPTLQLKDLAVNVDIGLEQEADDMGVRAVQTKTFRGGKSQAKLSHGFTEYGTKFIQRKVGFEFEDAYWKAWKKSFLSYFFGIRPAKRKELLHRGTGFNLEADDSLDHSSIEFVTDPFEPNAEGINKLNTAMTEIRDIMTRIRVYAGRNEEENQYVQPREHMLSKSNTLLSGGRNDEGNFKMQATQGVSLEDLPTIMKYFGTNVPDETPEQADERTNARIMQSGDVGGLPGITNVMGSAPILASRAVQHLSNNAVDLNDEQRGVFTGDTRALEGFLTEVILYAKMFTVNQNAYLKGLIPFMSRNDFSTLFRLIPLAQQRSLRANNARAFVNAIVEVLNLNQLIQVGNTGHFFDTNFTPDSPLIRSFRPQSEQLRKREGVIERTYPVFQSLTLGNWLNGMTIGKDYLTPKEMNNWLKVHEMNLTRSDRKRHLGYLESIASYGSKTDNPDREGNTKMGIFENRAILHKNLLTGVPNLTAPQAHKIALNYLTFYKNLKENMGNPGPYPDLEP